MEGVVGARIFVEDITGGTETEGGIHGQIYTTLRSQEGQWESTGKAVVATQGALHYSVHVESQQSISTT